MKNGPELLDLYTSEQTEDAFSELVQHYAGFVFSVARRRLQNNSHVDEITQKVFIRLAQSKARFDNEPQLLAWLDRTATNIAIDHWRSETRRRQREIDSTLMHDTDEPI